MNKCQVKSAIKEDLDGCKLASKLRCVINVLTISIRARPSARYGNVDEWRLAAGLGVSVSSCGTRLYSTFALELTIHTSSRFGITLSFQLCYILRGVVSSALVPKNAGQAASQQLQSRLDSKRCHCFVSSQEGFFFFFPLDARNATFSP
jgi:hypothetical protein